MDTLAQVNRLVQDDLHTKLVECKTLWSKPAVARLHRISGLLSE